MTCVSHLARAQPLTAARSAADDIGPTESSYGDLIPKALAPYGLTPPRADVHSDAVDGSPSDQWATDTRMRGPTVLQAEWHDAAGCPAWTYEFDRAIPPKPIVVHSSELLCVFGNLVSWGSQTGEYGGVDRALSAAMQAYWASFAKTGDPSMAVSSACSEISMVSPCDPAHSLSTLRQLCSRGLPGASVP